jgi:WD40 repeat protein/tRNA A-37 threonylcarbamoyl transferase component Bud32
MSDCPSLERWRRYQGEDVGPEEEQALLLHSDICRDCQELLRRLVAPAPRAAAREGPPPPVLDRMWAEARRASWPRFEHYELLDKVGGGATGEVFKARARHGDRVVALKVLRPALAADPVQRARFLAEAGRLRGLSHPGVVRVYESSEQDGRPFLCMELLEGGSLADRLPEIIAAPVEAARVLAAVATAVAYAHANNLIHRDLKPSNILFRGAPATGADFLAALRQGRLEPVVADFGLARPIEGGTGLTRSGEVLGTLDYLAPEQVSGKGLGPHTDVYALGAVLYACCTGRAPFSAATPFDTLVQITDPLRGPQRPSQLNGNAPRALETICLKCLEKAPQQRYASAADLAADLRNFAEGRPVRARPRPPWQRAWRAARRKPARALALVVAVLALFLAVAWWLLGAAWRLVDEKELARGEAASAYETAEEERKKARAAEAAALKARDEARLAEAGERAAKRALARVTAIRGVTLAHQHWRQNDLGLARALLEACPEDLRNWEWRFVNRLCHPELLTIPAHDGEVLAVAMSRDRRRVVSCGRDGTIKGWDARSGQRLYTVRYRPGTGPRSTVSMAAFTDAAVSPDASLIAAHVGGGAVRVWDGATGAERFTLPVKQKAVSEIAAGGLLEPRVATSFLFGVTHLWDGKTGKLLATYPGASDVALPAFGTRLALVRGFIDWNGWVEDTDAKKPVLQIKRGGLFSDQKEPQRVRLSPFGGELALFGNATGVELIEVPGGKTRLRLAGHRGGVVALGYHTAGHSIVTGGRDRTAKVWDAHTGQLKASLLGHTQAVTAVAFSPDGGRVLTGGGDGAVSVWDLSALPQEIARTYGVGGTFAPRAEAISPDGTRVLVSGGLSDPAAVVDARTGKRVFALPASVGFVAFSPNGRTLLVRSKKHFEVFSATTGRPVCTLQGYTGARHAFAPDGTRIVTGSDDKTARVWDARTGKQLAVCAAHASPVRVVRFSPDGARVASAGADGRVLLWQASTGQVLRELPPAAARSLLFLPNGKGLVREREDGALEVWDLETGRLGFRRPRACRHVGSFDERSSPVAVSPDGRRIAVRDERVVRGFDAMTGEERFTFHGHTDRVNVVAFSPDGSRLLSGSEDWSVKLWDLETGLEALTLRGHRGGVSAAAFGADGTWLVTRSGSLGNSDDRALVWEAPRLAPAKR